MRRYHRKPRRAGRIAHEAECYSVSNAAKGMTTFAIAAAAMNAPVCIEVEQNESNLLAKIVRF
jgi:hypothetical protein